MLKEKNFDFDKIIINFNIIKKAMKKSIDDILFKYQLNLMQVMHIMTLYKNIKPLFLNDLIEKIGVDKATTTRTVSDLIEKDFVEKSTNNIRKFKICLTKNGIKVAKHFYKERKIIIKKILFNFNDKEKENLIYLMEKMINSIEMEKK